MQRKRKKNLAGLSLIETILYLGIAVFVLGALFAYGWNVIGINIKTQVARETADAARLISEKLTYEIRRAKSAQVENDPAKLTLRIGSEDVIFENTGNEITLRRGSGAAVALHSSDIEIKDFVFEKQTDAADANIVEYVGFSFTASYVGATERSEYTYSIPVRSGAALRIDQ